MADIEFKVDNAALQQAVTAHLLKSLDEAARERIITQAIDYLTRPKQGTYYSNSSPLEDAFKDALRAFATDYAKKYVAENPIVLAKVQEHISKAMGSCVEKDDNLREATARAIATVLSERGS